MLSLGQDSRWRRAMVQRLDLPPGSLVLDLAAGTGQIGRELARHGHRVVSCDQSVEMLAGGAHPGVVVVATAERLPLEDGVFDGVTFGYLLRYVDDPAGCLAEITRVVRPGGRVAMVEFGRPRGAPGILWKGYTRVVLPAVGAAISPGWRRVGRFLGPSIEDFHRRLPPDRLVGIWADAGLDGVEWARMSWGGGLIMWGRRR
jgi:demethylmenaquinone methyltransferase/2-methoxy-6-polyprenyl-1,4-benzoquinol methylase